MAMRRILLLLLTPSLVFAQQPQTSVAPIVAVNVKYVQGYGGGGYWPQAGAGLILNIAAGTVICVNTATSYAGGTLTLTNSTTNYVYLDGAASCAPAFNTSGFTASSMPIAKVVTSGGVITTITDARTPFALRTGAAGAGTVTTTGSPASPQFACFSGATSITNCVIPHGLSFTIPNPVAGTSSASYDLLADIPFACTITAWSLAADTGTYTVKFWRVATGGTAIPTSGNSINTSGVSLASGTLVQSTTLTDFTSTAIAKGDTLIMDVTTVSGSPTIVNGVLQCDEAQ